MLRYLDVYANLRVVAAEWQDAVLEVSEAAGVQVAPELRAVANHTILVVLIALGWSG